MNKDSIYPKISLLALVLCVSSTVALAKPTDIEANFKRLDKQTQAIKLRVLNLNRDVVKYIAASKTKLSNQYNFHHRSDFMFHRVIEDQKRDNYLEAINRYHIGRDLGVIKSKYGTALKVANIYLDYGLYNYAKKIFSSLLGNEDSAVASLARYYLARHDYLKQYWDTALKGFESVTDGLPRELLDQKWIMQGIILQNRKQHRDAMAAFSNVSEDSDVYVYAQFNIAMSALRGGWWSDAEQNIYRLLRSLDNSSGDSRFLADRLHLALGYAQLQKGYHREAMLELAKVGDNSPFTYKARLGLGLVAAERESYQEALKIMYSLIEEYGQQVVSEEAYIIVPFLLESTDSKKVTISYYSRIVDHYNRSVSQVDAVIKTISRGGHDDEITKEFLYANKQPGDKGTKGKPDPIDKYLLRLNDNSRWLETRNYYRDLAELNQLLISLERKLKKVGSYSSKKYRKLMARLSRLLKDNRSLASRWTIVLRKMTAKSLTVMRSYFSSYLNQARFGLARNYDLALGNDTEIHLGELTIDEAKIRRAYRTYLDGADKKSVNRRAALIRLAELEVDHHEQLLAEENITNTIKKKAESRLNTSIALTDQALKDYPDHEDNDRLLYQLAKAYDKKNKKRLALTAMRQLADNYPHSQFYVEVQFKLGEKYLTGNETIDAELAYSAAIRGGNESSVFYLRAIYKRGWARLRQSLYASALEDFFEVLVLSEYSNKDKMSATEKTLFEDVLRAISLCFVNRDGLKTLDEYFGVKNNVKYAGIVYQTLGDLYISQERIYDAVGVFESYIERFPHAQDAPDFMFRMIETWAKNKYLDKELVWRKKFDDTYALNGKFWLKNDIKKAVDIKKRIKENIRHMTSHYHGLYQSSNSKKSLAAARYWYGRFFRFFSSDKDAAKTHFLYAELLSGSGSLKLAKQHYRKASLLGMKDSERAEAAYAGLLTADKLIKNTKESAERREHIKRNVADTLRFAKNYPKDKRTPKIMLNLLEGLFKRQQYDVAIEAYQHFPKSAKQILKDKAQVILAHSLFHLKKYKEAEPIYSELLLNTSEKISSESKLKEHLASLIYKQGELAVQANELSDAVEYFLRAAKVKSNSIIAATAIFDAATVLVKLKSNKKAIALLEDFNRRYPSHRLQGEVSKKLAVLYLAVKDNYKSAGEFERVADNMSNPVEIRRDALWQSATLYEKRGDRNKAIDLYKRYVSNYMGPGSQSVEAMYKLVVLNGKKGDKGQRDFWRKAVVTAGDKMGRKRTERIAFLAADSAMGLAKLKYHRFNEIQLSVPLKKSLKRKKKAMQRAIDSLSHVVNYGVEETTTHATHMLADVYDSFGHAIINSPQPKNLKGLALEQYQILLEEQAYPFEENAINFYKANVSQLKHGAYNRWIEDSLVRLRILLPARYAKKEKLEPFLEVANM